MTQITSNTKKSNKKIAIAITVLAAIIVIFAVIYVIAKPKANQGSKAVTIEVTDNEGKITTYETKTDAEYLGEVFAEIDDLTVEGTEGDYGLYIDTVNGLTADYAEDGAYWSIYVNGEYGNYSADQQPVADGDVYGLVYTVYEE